MLTQLACTHNLIPKQVLRLISDWLMRSKLGYCKRGNIRGALIFANFAQNSASANSKTHKNNCSILYAHFGHVEVVY